MSWPHSQRVSDVSPGAPGEGTDMIERFLDIENNY
jgi:hypothetical protein